MSIMLALLEPIEGQGIDETTSEIALTPRHVALIDSLVGTHYGETRAQVIGHIIELCASRETIGPCEMCGLVDHHLVKGLCTPCRARCAEGGGEESGIIGLIPAQAAMLDTVRERPGMNSQQIYHVSLSVDNYAQLCDGLTALIKHGMVIEHRDRYYPERRMAERRQS